MAQEFDFSRFARVAKEGTEPSSFQQTFTLEEIKAANGGSPIIRPAGKAFFLCGKIGGYVSKSLQEELDAGVVPEMVVSWVKNETFDGLMLHHAASQNANVF